MTHHHRPTHGRQLKNISTNITFESRTLKVTGQKASDGITRCGKSTNYIRSCRHIATSTKQRRKTQRKEHKDYILPMSNQATTEQRACQFRKSRGVSAPPVTATRTLCVILQRLGRARPTRRGLRVEGEQLDLSVAGDDDLPSS
jgi:hypothetical protein